jgi:hypothetical protein
MIALRHEVAEMLASALPSEVVTGIGEPMIIIAAAIVIAWIVITAIPSVDTAVSVFPIGRAARTKIFCVCRMPNRPSKLAHVSFASLFAHFRRAQIR